jgi:hypothetical protein
VHYFNISINKRGKGESYTRLPLLPPGLLVPSWGIGVTSSMRSMRKPNLARARMAAWAPGPGVLGPDPPGARTLMCMAVMPLSRAISAAAVAARMAA